MRVKMGISLFLTMLMTFIMMSLPLIFSQIISLLTDISKSLSLLPFILFGYGILWTLNQILEQMRTIIIMRVLESAIRKVNLSVFDHLHALSLRFHLDRQSGALMSAIDRAQFGIETLFWCVFLFVIPVMIELLLAVFIITYLYGIVCCLIMLLFMLIYIALNIYALKKTVNTHERYNQKRAAASAGLMDSLLNIETVRYFTNQKFDRTFCDKLLEEQEQAGIAKHRAEAFMQLGQMVIIGIALTCVTWFTGTAVAAGTMGISDFVLVNGYLLQFIMPLNHFAHAMQQMRKAWQDISEIQKILILRPEITDNVNSAPLNVSHAADIIFENVSFSYDENRTILKNISFSVPAGKTVAIVGTTGSGKSTMVRLLFRFFDVTAGSISINGHDIRLMTQESLHKAIGIVPQDAVLFNNTIYFNIAYGNPCATKEEVEQAAKDAQLEQFIKQLPDGYQTEVGERGLKLSGGEKQRIAIARVLLKKPLIYIFDEATSALDSATEREIQKNIMQLSFGNTTLIIAHRLSTIMHADSILVLENGSIVEQGNHHELLAQQNLYANLWHKQMRNMSI